MTPMLATTLIIYCDRQPSEHYDYICCITGNQRSYLMKHRKNRELVVFQETSITKIPEFYIRSRLRHANIAAMYSVYNLNTNTYAVSEYVELRVLDLLPFDEVETASFMCQVF